MIDLLKNEEHLLEKDLKRLTKASAKELRNTLQKLRKKEIVEIDAVLTTPSVRSKTVKTVRLAVSQSTLQNINLTETQQFIIDYLLANPGEIDVKELYEATGTNRGFITRLANKGLLIEGERIAFRDSLAEHDFIPTYPATLLPDQHKAWEIICQAIQGEKTGAEAFLLHGVTGSGKTEIYLHAIAETRKQGRQAILLVPEIALTPQTIRRVAARFPGEVALVHGSLTPRERYDTWTRARRGEIGVIVGTRSALFTPLPDIGLIVLDEEHDQSYKHAPPFNPPYYHALHVAEKMMNLNQGVLIAGSATPALERFHRAQRGEIHYLHLPGRIMGHRKRVENQSERNAVLTKYVPAGDDAMVIDLPPVDIVDMRIELKAGNRNMFSRDLQAELAGVLERGEQAILFLNRRGQSTYVFCRDCGYVVECPRCDTPMTYHRHGEMMQCHHCDNQMPTPKVCLSCGSDRIKYFGAGTQQVESALHELFPGVETVRWDADTANKPDMHDVILSRFIRQEAQVMIGTQMIAKGLDLPMVTLVGVISADPGLALPDFRARERAFQLLTQVAGRAGRGVLGGKVIIQTYQPEHMSILHAAQHDYRGFYEEEIEQRRKTGYPPFRRLVRVLVQNTHPVEVEREAEAVADLLKQQIIKHGLNDTTVIGPVPCFFSRLDRMYRWHVLLRGPDPRRALRDLSLPRNCYLDIDPVDVL